MPNNLQTAVASVNAAYAQSQAVMIVQPRSLNGFVADAVVEEVGNDRAEITDHPVEQGSPISDNMYSLPAELDLVYAWGISGRANTQANPNFLREIYASILALQQQQQVVTIYTGKRAYQNMVLRSIAQTTDAHTENALMLRIGCRQVIIVSTQTFTLPTAKSQVATPQTSLQTVKTGQQQPQPAQPSPSMLQSIANFFKNTELGTP